MVLSTFLSHVYVLKIFEGLCGSRYSRMDQKKFAEDRRMSSANFTWSVLEYLDLCKGRAHPSYTVIRNVAKVIV